MTQREVAINLSGGDFLKVLPYLAENVEWYIYEEKMTLNGKKNVSDFLEKVGTYFETMTTKFETFGIIEEGNKVSIYGRAEFIKESKTLSIVHSCDVYEFDENRNVTVIYSYCNTKKTEDEV